MERSEDAIQPNTKMIWVETPSNPLLNITDLNMIAKVAKERHILTVADNTFPSPYFPKTNRVWDGPCSPFNNQIHQRTQRCDGGGAIVTTTEKLADDVHFLLNGMGTNAAPFDSWLILRGT